MQNVTGARRTELHGARRLAAPQAASFGRDDLVEFADRGAAAERDIIHGASRRGPCGGGENVCLHDVGHVREVARGAAVAMDRALAATHERVDPLRNHGGVTSGWILPRAKDVEVAQAGRGESVMRGELLRVDFTHRLRCAIRRERPAGLRLDFALRVVVAINRAGAGIDDAPDTAVTGGDEDIERAGDIGGVAGQRVFQRKRHGNEARLMQHEIHSVYRPRGRCRCP